MSESQSPMDLYRTERLAEKEKLDAACEEITAAFRKHFPDTGDNLNAPVALAACLELFPCDDALEIRQLYAEWTMEHFAGRKVRANLEGFEKLYDSLVEGGYDGGEPYIYNDGDNDLFYIPHETAKIVVHTSQNRNYFYMLEYRRFHVRRFYDEYNFGDDGGAWQLEGIKSRKKCTLQALAMSDDLLHYSDCVKGCQYPQRPSLQFFKDCDFDLMYKDARDKGYVATYNDLCEPRVDWAIHNYQELSMSFFYLRQAIEGAEAGFTGC